MAEESKSLVRLPKITPEHQEAWRDAVTMLEWTEGVGYSWTQEAVDFACEVAAPAVQAENERLRAGDEAAIRHLRGIVNHWNEFGPDGLDERMHYAYGWLQRLPAVSGSAVETAGKHTVCEGCGNEIDPDVCGCGSPITHSSWEGHSPVPMGCDCMRVAGPEASGEATGPEGDDSNMGTAPTSGPEATSSQGNASPTHFDIFGAVYRHALEIVHLTETVPAACFPVETTTCQHEWVEAIAAPGFSRCKRCGEKREAYVAGWCYEHGYRQHKRGSPACELAAEKASEVPK